MDDRSGIVSGDELAGVVDLFGALTPDELTTAVDELAFKRGQEATDEAVMTAIETATARFVLVEIGGEAVHSVNSGSPTSHPDPTSGSADDGTTSVAKGGNRPETGADVGVDSAEIGSAESAADTDCSHGTEPGSNSALETVGVDHTDTDTQGETYLAVGPGAFPVFPDGAADLPHILSVPAREVNRDHAAVTVESRLTTAADVAIASDDDVRVETLLNVCFDLETWADVDVTGIRDQLEDESLDYSDGDH
jgi:hypothetical protein